MKNYQIELLTMAVSRKIEDKYFLVPLNGDLSKNGFLFETNEIGSFIWEKIAKDNIVSISHLINAVLSEYDVDEKIASADVSDFLEQMQLQNILKISN